MSGINWARVYHAYFQTMVVEGLTELARRSMGVDMGFNMVAGIVEKGAMRGFSVLLDELSKAGVSLSGVSLRDLLDYEVRCHRFAVEKMGVGFQVFEEAVEEEAGRRYSLRTTTCRYAELAAKNPVVCAVCVGLVSGILKRFGLNVRWVRDPSRARLLCRSGEKPEWVVYRDPGVELPRCRLVIERLECSGEG